MASHAFVFPLTPGKTEEWRSWGEELLGPRRSEYEAFRRHLGLTAHRMYLQHTPQGYTAIMYLEGNDLQRTFQVLRTSQDPFGVWFRQRASEHFIQKYAYMYLPSVSEEDTWQRKKEHDTTNPSCGPCQ